MQNYKLVLLLRSSIKKEEKEKLFSSISKWVATSKNDKQESLGDKKLAYPIKKELKGEYVVMNFDANTIPKDFAKRVVNQEGVLRHLLIKN